MNEWEQVESGGPAATDSGLSPSPRQEAEGDTHLWGEDEWDALDSLLRTTDAEWLDYQGGSHRDVLHQALARFQVRAVAILGECDACGAVGREQHHEECPF